MNDRNPAAIPGSRFTALGRLLDIKNLTLQMLREHPSNARWSFNPGAYGFLATTFPLSRTYSGVPYMRAIFCGRAT